MPPCEIDQSVQKRQALGAPHKVTCGEFLPSTVALSGKCPAERGGICDGVSSKKNLTRSSRKITSPKLTPMQNTTSTSNTPFSRRRFLKTTGGAFAFVGVLQGLTVDSKAFFFAASASGWVVVQKVYTNSGGSFSLSTPGSSGSSEQSAMDDARQAMIDAVAANSAMELVSMTEQYITGPHTLVSITEVLSDGDNPINVTPDGYTLDVPELGDVEGNRTYNADANVYVDLATTLTISYNYSGGTPGETRVTNY